MKMSNIIYIITAIVFLTLLTLSFMPYITRKTESFGVSIPEQAYDNEELKKMRKQYALITLLISGLIIFLFYLLIQHMSETVAIISFCCSVFFILMSDFLVYIPFHYKMKRIKEEKAWHAKYEQRVVIDTTFHEEKTSIAYRWYNIPFLLIIVTIVYTFSIYEQIPNEVPIHTSFSGAVTYSKKSVGTLLIIPISQLFLLGVMLIVQYVINHTKQELSATDPERSKLQVIQFRRYWSIYLYVSTLLITFMFFGMQLTFIYPNLLSYENYFIIPIIALLLIGAIILSIVTGQGGSRINLDSNKHTQIIDRDDDRYWKLGQFYFNKNDPAIFIEKRFGVGWTNNWARPVSWILLIAIIALPIIIIISLLYLL